MLKQTKSAFAVSLLLFLFSTITFAQEASTYCSIQTANTSYEWIAAVSVGNLNNESSASYYSDFTAQSIELVRGAPVALSLTPGPVGNNWTESWKVFIDLNADGDFEDDGETVFEKTQKGQVTGTFTMPFGASLGVTRMRIAMQYYSPPPACGSYNYGEVEDYTIEIVDSGPPNLSGIAADEFRTLMLEAGYPEVEKVQVDLNISGNYPDGAGSRSSLKLNYRHGDKLMFNTAVSKAESEYVSFRIKPLDTCQAQESLTMVTEVEIFSTESNQWETLSGDACEFNLRDTLLEETGSSTRPAGNDSDLVPVRALKESAIAIIFHYTDPSLTNFIILRTGNTY